MKRARMVSVGLSAGVAALAATVLVTTPATAASGTVASRQAKAQAYCDHLPHRTAVEQMKVAACDNQTLMAASWVAQQITSHAMSVSEAVNRAAWPDR